MIKDLPNLLTLVRIMLIPLLVIMLSIGRPWSIIMAGLFYIFAVLTDYLDGVLARALQQFSDFGRIMDPIADKLLVGTLLLALSGLGRLSFHGCLYAALLILVRELTVSGLREYLAGMGANLSVTYLAKCKTSAQMIALWLLMAGKETSHAIGMDILHLDVVGAIMLWVSAVITLITGWDYLMVGFRYLQGNRSDI